VVVGEEGDVVVGLVVPEDAVELVEPLVVPGPTVVADPTVVSELAVATGPVVGETVVCTVPVVPPIDVVSEPLPTRPQPLRERATSSASANAIGALRALLTTVSPRSTRDPGSPGRQIQ
jgi:hypothetical protein